MTPIPFDRWLAARTREGDGDCIEWTRACSGNGYPAASWCGSVRNVRTIVWEQTGGAPLGRRQLVMTCRNRLCVHRGHMAAKSRTEVHRNWASYEEMALRYSLCAKRRDRAPARKLTIEQAREIRARLAAGGVTQAQLAESYGVRKDAIGRIWRGESWREAGAANSSVFTWRPAA